jgi:hypothetical protein
MDLSFLSAGLFIQCALGISLSACAGLRAFLPLLVMSILVRYNYMVVGDSFSWIGSTPTLVIFGVATVIEILGDKFPVVNHFLDSVGILAKPIAGTLLFSTVVVKFDPTLAVVLGIMVGGTVSEVVHVEKSGLRLSSSVLSGGVGNPVISIIEDITAFIGVIISFLAPFIMLGLAIIGMYLLFRVYKKFCGNKKVQVQGAVSCEGVVIDIPAEDTVKDD